MPLPKVNGEFNVVMDPETKFLDSGKTMVKLRVVAKTRKKVDGSWVDGDSSFFNIIVWDPFAANLIEAGVSKGDTIFVSGKIRERQFEKDGEKRSTVEISVGDQDDSVGLSSRWPRSPKRIGNAQANIDAAKSALGATDGWQEDVAPF